VNTTYIRKSVVSVEGWGKSLKERRAVYKEDHDEGYYIKGKFVMFATQVT